MSKVIIIDKCGDCPYCDAQVDNHSWYCIEPSGIDTYGVGIKLGENNMDTLGNIPGGCPLGDAKI